MEKLIYLTYPEGLQGSEEVDDVIDELEKAHPEYEVMDSPSIEVEGGRVSCRDCMERLKKIFFPLIEKSEIFAIWSPIATCEIKCELHKAWELGKKVIHISYMFEEFEFEEMSLQEYHLIESEVEVE